MLFTKTIVPLTLTFLIGVIGCSERTAPNPSADSATSNSADVVLASVEPGDIITISVPSMSCTLNCYPKVKETLQKQEGLDAESVQLVEQEHEVTIDDPRINIKVTGPVDQQKILAAITEAGYAGATITAATP